MVSDRACIFHIYIPWDKILSLVPKSSIHVSQTHLCLTLNWLLHAVLLFFFWQSYHQWKPQDIMTAMLKFALLSLNKKKKKMDIF